MASSGYRYKTSYRKGTTHKLAGRTLIPVNKAIPGEFNVSDDRTSFKVKSSQTILTWDGFIVDKTGFEPRTPQDFVRAVKDQKPLPSSRIRVELPFHFGSETEEGLINSLLLRK